MSCREGYVGVCRGWCVEECVGEGVKGKALGRVCSGVRMRECVG